MASAAPNHDEIGQEVLERMRLLQVARGRPATFWLGRAREHGKLLLAVVGAILVYEDFTESPPHTWIVALGVVLLVAGLSPRRDDSSERLDALIRFLDRKGQLSAVDAGMGDPPSA